MPNWVSNRLFIPDRVVSAPLVTAINDAITAGNGFIPRFIPFPENGHKQVLGGITVFTEDDPKVGTIDGVEWCADNWGVKWGDCRTDHDDSFDGWIGYKFDTAWGEPDKAMLTISGMFPEVSMFLLSIEEQPSFRGWWHYKGGKVVDEKVDHLHRSGGVDIDWPEYPESGTPVAYGEYEAEMARIWEYARSVVVCHHGVNGFWPEWELSIRGINNVIDADRAFGLEVDLV
jgi:hypothetical protein